MNTDVLKKAKKCAGAAARLSNDDKNRALMAMADCLVQDTDEILRANEIDVKEAVHLSSVMVDRLILDSGRIAAMAEGLRNVSKLPDPVGRVLDSSKNENGLLIEKVSVPFGVIAVIF